MEEGTNPDPGGTKKEEVQDRSGKNERAARKDLSTWAGGKEKARASQKKKSGRATEGERERGGKEGRTEGRRGEAESGVTEGAAAGGVGGKKSLARSDAFAETPAVT